MPKLPPPPRTPSLCGPSPQGAAAAVPCLTLGRSGGKRIRIAIGGKDVIDAPLDEVAQAWSTGLSRYFEDSAA